MPDPFGKKNICGEDTPLHGAKNGQYNLNWIDDQNEYRHLISAEESIAKGECPIYGMDLETFEDILREQDY